MTDVLDRRRLVRATIESEDGIPENEELVALLDLVRSRGLSPGDSCAGGEEDPFLLAWVLFPFIADGVEFLLHTARGMNFKFENQIAMTLHRPPGSEFTIARCTWHPSMTNTVFEAWRCQAEEGEQA